MTKTLFQNLAEKVGTGFWSLDQNRLSFAFFYLLLIFLPTQFGKHFFPKFSFVFGLPSDYLSPTLYFTDILIVLIFVFSVRKILRIILSKFQKHLFFYLLFLLSLTVGVVLSANPPVGFLGIIKFIEYSFLFTFVFLNLNKFNKKIFAYCLALAIVFETILSFAQFLNQGSFQGIFYFLGERNFNAQTPGIANASINGSLILRPYGTFPHPNVLAGFLEVSLILFLSFRAFLSKYLKTIILLVSILGVLISFSRASILALFLSLLLLFVSTIVEKYQKVSLNSKVFNRKNTLIICLLIFTTLIFINSIFAKRFLSTNLTDESIVQREQLINQAVLMFSKNPILGVGINNFINNLNPSFNSPLLLQPVHNIFLLIISETGIIGLFSFLSIFLLAFYKTIKIRINIFKLSILMSILLIGMLDHYFLTIQQGQILLTISLSYVLSKDL